MKSIAEKSTMVLRKYTIVYKDGLTTHFLHIEGEAPKRHPEKGWLLWEPLLSPHNIEPAQLWFIFDGHCQPSIGWDGSE